MAKKYYYLITIFCIIEQNQVDLSKVSCLQIDKDDYKSKHQLKKQNKLKKKNPTDAGKNWYVLYCLLVFI